MHWNQCNSSVTSINFLNWNCKHSTLSFSTTGQRLQTCFNGSGWYILHLFFAWYQKGQNNPVIVTCNELNHWSKKIKIPERPQFVLIPFVFIISGRSVRKHPDTQKRQDKTHTNCSKLLSAPGFVAWVYIMLPTLISTHQNPVNHPGELGRRQLLVALSSVALISKTHPGLVHNQLE